MVLSVDRNAKKLQLTYTDCECVNWYNPLKNSSIVTTVLEHTIHYDAKILLLDIYPTEVHAYAQETYTI